ncbi:hypothetical protein K502DRAFT_303869 [Neoconidiobolus thromboides FSU 785]|nr:hypothetical protein K502DRAFT_303869 [Neoconidiobolus thromboides FSU 785]
MITPLLNGDGKEISNYIQRLYNNGTIVCLTPSQVNIVLNYFYFLHDQNLLIDYNRFIMFLTSPMYTTSFKFLLNCLFIVTTKNLPHLQEEYINLYSTDIIAKELENLTCIMNSFFNNERELDLMMNRELGLSLMNLTFN